MRASRAATALVTAHGGESGDAAIRAAVDELLAEAEVTGPPAPLELLASFCGVIRIEPVTMPNPGRLVEVGDHHVIQVNATDTPGRQRFSIAHEICHRLVDRAQHVARSHEDTEIGIFDAEREPEEYLCDIGAAHLLLHPDWLHALGAHREPSLDALFEIATACEASAEATARQLVTLGVWRCTFAWWAPGYSREEARLVERGAAIAPKLRVERLYAAEGMPFLPRNKSVSEHSSIAAALVDRERRTSGTERFDLSGQELVADSESRYAGYLDASGNEAARVLTLMRWRSAGASRLGGVDRGAP